MLWKIYLCFVAFISFFGIIYLFRQTSLSIIDIVGAASGILLLTALYSYIFRKTFLDPKNWKYIFYFESAYFAFVILASLGIINISFLSSRTKGINASDLINVILYIPAFLALHRLTKVKKTKSRKGY